MCDRAVTLQSGVMGRPPRLTVLTELGWGYSIGLTALTDKFWCYEHNTTTQEAA